MPEVEALAKRLRRIRKKMGLSQMEFAAECGVDPDTISNIELEKTDTKLSTLQKVTAYLGCSVSDLLKVGNDSEAE